MKGGRDAAALGLLGIVRGAASAPAPEVPIESVDEQAQRQALRRELQEAFVSCTATAARQWLGKVTGRGGLLMVTMLDAVEVKRARALLAARKAGA